MSAPGRAGSSPSPRPGSSWPHGAGGSMKRLVLCVFGGSIKSRLLLHPASLTCYCTLAAAIADPTLLLLQPPLLRLLLLDDHDFY